MHLLPFIVQKSLEAYTGGWLTKASRGMIPPHPESDSQWRDDHSRLGPSQPGGMPQVFSY